ncbi:Tissue factor pathway inhibitor 2, partial [Trichuris trichiura]
MHDIVGPYAGVYKWLYKTAPFRQDLPSIPVDQLPYYHGRIRHELAAQRLCCNGDFLIYAEGDEEPSLVLLVRDQFSKCVQIDINYNQNHHFWIYPMDEEYGYSTVDALIRNHVNMSTTFKLDECAFARLEHAVSSPEFLSSIRCEGKVDPVELRYFHEIAAQDAEEILCNSGDFILKRSDKDAKAIDLMVRWEEEVKTMHGLGTLGNSVYPLFKTSTNLPDEHVYSLDDYLKSSVLCQHPINGVLLKKPIFHATTNRSAIEDNAQPDENDGTLNTHELNETAVQQAATSGGLMHTLLNYCAPRPISSLPYFHGYLSEEEAQTLLHNDGDFLLFIDKLDGQLYVVLHKNREMVADWHYREVRTNFYNRAVFIRDKDKDLNYLTVDELIAYYQTYAVPIQEGAQWTTANEANKEVLRYPVTSCTCQKDIMLEVNTFRYNLSYYNMSLSDEKVSDLLVEEGDYLLRGRDYEEDQLCVKWNRQIHKLPVPKNGYDGNYTLPHKDPTLPEEHSITLDGLLKTYVLCQIPYKGKRIFFRNVLSKRTVKSKLTNTSSSVHMAKSQETLFFWTFCSLTKTLAQRAESRNEKSSEEVADPGPCRGKFPRYYYDWDSKQCTQFTYGGCEGNANNYDSIAECEATCPGEEQKPENPCELPSDSGPCMAYFTKYYYNKESKKCETFVYGGCQGNENRFDTLEECEAKCAEEKPVKDPCKLPADPGPCRGKFPRYYYDWD